MTKFLVALSLTLLFAATASPQPKITDLGSESLKGPVRFVTGESSTSHSLDGPQEKEPPKKLDSLTFDSQGLLVKRVIHDYYGLPTGTARYSHDRAGHLLTMEMFDVRGSSQYKQARRYGPGDHLLETILYDGKAAAFLKELYIYDKQGHLAAEVYYDRKDVFGKTAFQNDERGHPVWAAFFLADGSKAVAPVGPCSNVHRVEYAYDSEGRVMEQTGFEPNGSVKQKSSYRYDERGNVAELVTNVGLAVLKYVHSYEYDSQGNWISHTVRTHVTREPLSGAKPEEVVQTTISTRKITYY